MNGAVDPEQEGLIYEAPVSGHRHFLVPFVLASLLAAKKRHRMACILTPPGLHCPAACLCPVSSGYGANLVSILSFRVSAIAPW